MIITHFSKFILRDLQRDIFSILLKLFSWSMFLRWSYATAATNERPRWSEITIMLYTSPLCSLIIHEGFWEEIISDLMETHQSLTDVPLHNLQLPTSQTHRRTLLRKIPFAISNRLVRSSQYTNQALSLSVWLFKPGFTLAEVCLLKYIPFVASARQQTLLLPTVSTSSRLAYCCFHWLSWSFFPLLLITLLDLLQFFTV